MRLPIVFAAAIFLSTAALRAQDRPALPLEKAVAIAVDYLKAAGKDRGHWIASISYERATLTSGKYKWFIKWAPAMDIGGRKELGLEIDMDGTAARAVDKKAPK